MSLAQLEANIATKAPASRFNPPKGILFIVTLRMIPPEAYDTVQRFNPPKGILFIVTLVVLLLLLAGVAAFMVSIPRRGFSSLSPKRGRRPASEHVGFNPPKGILFIVTQQLGGCWGWKPFAACFNPPKGILFIVTWIVVAIFLLIMGASFNPPKGILFIVTLGGHDGRQAVPVLNCLSFNPPKGILFIVTPGR